MEKGHKKEIRFSGNKLCPSLIFSLEWFWSLRKSFIETEQAGEESWYLSIPSFILYFSIFPSSSRFLLPVTSVLLRGDEAACSVFWVCFHGVSARTKLPKMVISLIGPPSAKCLGKIFKNLENILSPPLGFHLRGNASVKLSKALNLLVVAAAAVPSVPPGPVGGSVYPMASLQQDLAVGQWGRLCCFNLNIQDMKLYLLDVKGRICFANL